MRTGLSCLISLLIATTAAASGFELSGTVLDESGLGLSGARLTLVHEATGTIRDMVASDAGRYRFSGLPPGEYSLEAAADGFATSRFAGLRYFADTKPLFNITLRLREVQESMTFTGEAPLINVSQSQVGQSVDERQLDELPLERRDYLELVTFEGGAHEIVESPPGKPSVGAPRQSISGAGASYTWYQLDGFSNTRDQHGAVLVDVDVDAVEEFRVLSGQHSSEYGRSLAGIVSATTHSGANEFHGTAYAHVRPGAFSASDPLTGEGASVDRQDLGFTLSGPIGGGERTQFFSSFSYRNEREDVVVTAPFDDGRFAGLIELPEERLRFLVKVTHQFNDRHQLAVKSALSRSDALDGVGGFDVAANAVDLRNDDASFYGTLLSELDFGVNEVRVGFASERFEAQGRTPPLGSVQIHPTLGRIGNPVSSERVDEDHVELSDVLSLPLGDHNVDLGASLLRIGSKSALVRYGDGVSFFSPGDATRPILEWRSFPPEGGDPRLDRGETHVQVFASDDWQLTPYLTLNLGLRWEKESSVPDNDNFAPRMGFFWDATSDGRTAVRGGYGVFYSFVFSIVDSLERLYSPLGRSTMASVPGIDDGTSASNWYVTAPAYAPDSRRSPKAQHFTLGVERELLPTLTAAVDVRYIRGSELILPVDLNAPTFFDYGGGSVRGADAADRARPFGAPGAPIAPGTVDELPNGFPFAGYRDLYLLSSSGSSRFWGVKLNVTKRYSADVLLQAVYHWSRTRNDGDDYRVLESTPLDPARRDLEWGRSATDIPHSLVVNGVWDAPLGLRVTGLFRARSGRAVDARVDEDLDGDRKLRERVSVSGRIVERNSFRAPGTAALDLSLAKVWELGEGRSLTGTLEVFNATNRLNPRQYLETYGRDDVPLASFLQVTQAAPPRQVQLSVRLSF